MEKKASISGIGTCIIRDIVGMHDNDAGYEVYKYVQSLNPISIVGKSPLIKKFEAKDVFLINPISIKDVLVWI